MGLTVGCTGSIMDGASDDGRGANGGGGGSGGTGNIGGGILPDPIGEPACESTKFTPARVWRLSDEQYVAAVKDLVPGVDVPTILTPGRSKQQFIDFAELYDFNPATTSDVRGSINAVAADAVKNLDGLLACKGGEDGTACAHRFVEGFASRAFRRPLDSKEKDGLKAVYAVGAKVSAAEGIRMVLSAVLNSGSFLYRTELGKTNTVGAGETVEMTPHELASSLSFLLLNSIPDPALRAAADDGSLVKPEAFKAQVERLLKLPRVQDHLTTVYLKYVGLGTGINADLVGQEKEFTPALKASMEQATQLFVKEMLSKGGTVSDLLTSNKGFVDKGLATHLGVTVPAGTDFVPVSYPAAERSGILTTPGVIARYSLGHPEVFRGKFIRDEFLCYEIPPPPPIPEVEMEAEAAKNLPARTQAERRLKNPLCTNCHEFMDPLGLTFSNYDALGRFHRTEPTGGTIDASGVLSGAGNVDGPVTNAVDLGQKLAKSATVRTCVETKMMGYALGRLTEDFDSCELKKIDSFVTTGGGKLSDLMAGIIYSSAFRLRTGGN